MEDGEQATTFLSIRHKIVFIGNPTAGKTSLLNCYVTINLNQIMIQL